MRFLRVSLTFLIALTFLSACGKKQKNFEDYTPSNYGDPGEPIDFEGASLFFSCNSGECLPGQTLILHSTWSEISSCSGTLIEDDLVLTNSHCVDDSKDSCDNLTFIFPSFADGHDGPTQIQQRSCKEILSVSAEEQEKRRIKSDLKTDLDFALVRLDTKVQDRASAEYSIDGVRDGEVLDYSASMISSYEGNFFARPVKKDCVAVMNSWGVPSFFEEQSPLVGVADCSSRPGNSGSGLRGEGGAVKALVQVGYEDDSSENLGLLFQSFEVSHADYVVLPATNLSCVSELPGRSRSLEQSCIEKTQASYLQRGIGHFLMDWNPVPEVKASSESENAEYAFFFDEVEDGKATAIWGPTCVKAATARKLRNSSNLEIEEEHMSAIQTFSTDSWSRFVVENSETIHAHSRITVAGSVGTEWEFFVYINKIVDSEDGSAPKKSYLTGEFLPACE